ncbi:MAG: RluA family pseudouridine synthase [Bacillota bacterium]
MDKFLTDQLKGQSRSRLQKLIESGRVLVNSSTCTDKNYRLNPGDRINISIPPAEEPSVEPENLPLDIVYEDRDLLVINKPRGMVVHPGPGHRRGTLVNALLYHCHDLSGIGGVLRPGIVHRLDKDTAGLLLVAKNDTAHRDLSKQLSSRKLKREYIALVKGIIEPAAGRIQAPIARHPGHRKKMAVLPGGREAVTCYRVLKYFTGYSLLRLNLETGRTHQIRVHMVYKGHPVAGDRTYGGRSWDDLPQQLAEPHALYARKIIFRHPGSGEPMEFRVPLPNFFKEGLLILKN